MSARTANPPLRHDPRRSAAVFAALADETRLRLLSRLAPGKAQSITQLAAGLPVTRQAVTKHLRVLERAQLVTAEPNGRERRFVVRAAGIAEAQVALQSISEQWDDSLERLKPLVESNSGSPP